MSSRFKICSGERDDHKETTPLAGRGRYKGLRILDRTEVYPDDRENYTRSYANHSHMIGAIRTIQICPNVHNFRVTRIRRLDFPKYFGTIGTIEKIGAII